MSELRCCSGILSNVTLSDKSDKWSWVGGEDSEFSVGVVKRFLGSGIDYSSRYVFEWSKWVPKKCNIFMWHVVQNKVPTVDALWARNYYNGDMGCVLCNNGDKAAEHLFCSCYVVVAAAWSAISAWCKIGPLFLFSIKDLVEVHNHVGLNLKDGIALKGIIIVASWCLWKARNNKRFANVEVKIDDLIQDIKSNGFCGINIE
ncbi:uncharacterized protein LOC110901710 [Helianthus annuus]|uniref:uncharacterized protein LOC110901710 n=1 Tax=Helianthus annuus TaxID=4232 RepID=UPI000B90220E|nr:uncharacterized protein LOC110901710 [Helianthus annuus]